MKDGICPKCSSKEVYLHDGDRHGIVVLINFLAVHPTVLYICADCGYLEFYAETGFDLNSIKEKESYKKVKK